MQHDQQASAQIQIIEHLPPLFLCTLIFIGGIIWQSQSGNLIILAILMVLLTACSFVYSSTSQWKTIVPWAVAAFSIGALRNTLNEYYHLRQAEQLCHRKINLTGTIINKEITRKHWVTSLTISLNFYENFSGKHQAENTIITLYCMQPLPCEFGDTIEAHDVYLKQQTGSLSIFFKKQGIVATGYVGKQQGLKIIKKPGNTISSWLYTKREYILKRFSKILSPRTFMLVSSIFLGYKTVKTKMSDILYEQFQWWGISHYLARSGLHLVMFVLILHLLFMFLPIPFIIKQLIVTSCIAAYMLLSWSSISFIRSLLMIFCYLICSVFKMQQHGLHTISLACCAILLYNPAFLFALDFQLSFGLTLALILLYHTNTIRKNAQLNKSLA